MEQLEDNLKAADLQLAAQGVEQLSCTTAPALLYTAWVIEGQKAKGGRGLSRVARRI